MSVYFSETYNWFVLKCTILAKSIIHDLFIKFLIFLKCVHSFVGPEKWPELFPMASGHRQSPVNISRDSTTRGSVFKFPLAWRYVPSNTKSLINPGYCWRVDVNGEGSSLSRGPLLTDVFQLEQFHCHWGCSDGKGEYSSGISKSFHHYIIIK